MSSRTRVRILGAASALMLGLAGALQLLGFVAIRHLSRVVE